MTIGQVAKKSGISKDTVRYYTARGLIDGGIKLAGSREYADYASDVVERIGIIKKVQNLGFTLAEIKVLLDEITVAPGCKLSPSQLALLKAKLQEITDKQQQLKELSHFIRDKIKSLS